MMGGDDLFIGFTTCRMLVLASSSCTHGHRLVLLNMSQKQQQSQVSYVWVPLRPGSPAIDATAYVAEGYDLGILLARQAESMKKDDTGNVIVFNSTQNVYLKFSVKRWKYAIHDESPIRLDSPHGNSISQHHGAHLRAHPPTNTSSEYKIPVVVKNNELDGNASFLKAGIRRDGTTVTLG